jgi:hypothetical protein
VRLSALGLYQISIKVEEEHAVNSAIIAAQPV